MSCPGLSAFAKTRRKRTPAPTANGPFAGAQPLGVVGSVPDDARHMFFAERPVRDGAGVRFLRVFANAEQPGTGHPPAAVLGTRRSRRLARRGLHARGDPVRAVGGSRRQLFRRGLHLRRAAGAGTFTGTFTVDDSAAPHPYLAGGGLSGEPAAPRPPGYPWGGPSTTRASFRCWEGGDAADCDRVVGNLASAGAWTTSQGERPHARPASGTTRTRPRRGRTPRCGTPPAYMPTSPSRDYLLPLDERLVHGPVRAPPRDSRLPARRGTTRLP